MTALGHFTSLCWGSSHYNNKKLLGMYEFFTTVFILFHVPAFLTFLRNHPHLITKRRKQWAKLSDNKNAPKNIAQRCQFFATLA